MTYETEQEMLDAEEAILKRIRRDNISVKDCFKEYVMPGVGSIRGGLALHTVDNQQSNKYLLLDNTLMALQKSLLLMESSENPKEKTAALEIAAQHAALFHRLQYQQQFYGCQQGFFQKMHNGQRAQQLQLPDRQKACFDALSTAYGEKINKPFLVTVVVVLVAMVGMFVGMPHLLPLLYSAPVVGAILAKGFTMPLVGMPITLGSVGTSVVLSQFINKFRSFMGQYFGSSKWGVFEIDHEKGENLSKSINEIIRLSNEVLDDGEKNTLKKQQEGSTERDRYDYNDPGNAFYDNPSIQNN